MMTSAAAKAPTVAARTKQWTPQLRERYSRQILFAEIGEQGQERPRVFVGRTSGLRRAGHGAGQSAGARRRGTLAHRGSRLRRSVESAAPDAFRGSRRARSLAQGGGGRAPPARHQLRRRRSKASLPISTPRTPRICWAASRCCSTAPTISRRACWSTITRSRHAVPWVYAAVVASYGVTMDVRPGETACLACLVEVRTAEPPAAAGQNPEARGSPPTSSPTCDTVGVLGAAAGVIASIEAASALKLLLGKFRAGRRPSRLLRRLDRPLPGHSRRAPPGLPRLRPARIPLPGGARRSPTSRCADAIRCRFTSGGRAPGPRDALGRHLAAGGGEVRHNEFLLRFRVPPYEVTVFADGRAIVKGTRDPAVARSLYARYIGA